MSSDERPAKVRVYSSRDGSLPYRRRNDPETDTPVQVEAVVAAPVVQPSRISTVTLALFIVGCAIGGALVAWFGLVQGEAS